MLDKKISKDMISKMSKQSLRSSRMRNIFVMITIVLASALLMTVQMYAAGEWKTVQRQVSHMHQVAYYNLTEEQVKNLKNDDRLAYQIQVKTGVKSEIDGLEVVPYYTSAISDKIQIGEIEKGNLPEKENEIALQRGILEKMGIEPEPGSEVSFEFYDGNKETFKVTGVLKGGEDAKQFSLFFSKAYAEKGSQLKDYPYDVYAKLYGASQMHPEDCKEAMYIVGNDAGIERKNINPSKAFIDSLTMDFQHILIFAVIGAVILIACILVIYGVFYLSVIGKTHQFGQLRTIGMTKKQLKKLVSKEGRSLFLQAIPVGILIGTVAGYMIIPSGFSVINTMITAVSTFVIIYIVTMISVHKPAAIAAAVSPVEALRYVPQDGMKKKSNKKICRNLTPAGMGIMNFSKNRKKAVITMFSLALGGILFMTAATYMSSFDKEGYSRQGNFKNAEFDIFYSGAAVEVSEYGMSGLQAENPMDDDMVEQILAIDGVKKVSLLKNFGINFDFPERDEYDNDDMVYPISEDDAKNIRKYIEEGSYDYDKLMSGDYVLVADNSNVEEIYGWRYKPGDELTFHYYNGKNMSERKVKVLGILNNQYTLDHTDITGWFVMPEKAVLEFVSFDTLNADVLVSSEPEKEEAVGEALSKIVDERTELEMDTLSDRRKSDKNMVSTLFGAISGLSIFIMMFSILSMMNTLITNIVTRKQELAMLESIGMTKKQIKKMLLGESLILVIATVGVTMTIGAGCGYMLCKILYNMGAAYMSFRFPLGFALAYGVVLVAVPMIITFVSMKSFSKEALVERLRGAEC